GVVPGQQLVGVGGEAEEVVLLLHALDGRQVDPAQLAVALGDDVVLALGLLAPDAVHAVVLGLVDVVSQAVPHLGDGGPVPRLRGPDEVVVGDPDLLPALLESGGDPVAVGLWILAALARDAFDLLAVLVEAGQEEDVVLPEPG